MINITTLLEEVTGKQLSRQYYYDCDTKELWIAFSKRLKLVSYETNPHWFTQRYRLRTVNESGLYGKTSISKQKLEKLMLKQLTQTSLGVV